MGVNIYTFTAPITVGQYPDQVSVSRIRVASLSLNFQSPYKSTGTAVCSVILEDVDTGRQFSVVTLIDAPSLQLAQDVLAGTPANRTADLTSILLELAAEQLDPVSGKPSLPAGSIVAAS